MTGDGGCRSGDVAGGPASASESYRRALALVVWLNLAMGAAEMLGGMLGRSQSLKADALDFIGDGLITLTALAALAHGARWRARAAMLQGAFLCVLGLGVIGAAAYRVIERARPDAGVMTWLGAAGLAVNVACALLLVPHRDGDVSARAVWVFSRNDAIGNVCVLIAAGLVAWTGTSWPDLAIAVLIGGVFLRSAVGIIVDARRELRKGAV